MSAKNEITPEQAKKRADMYDQMMKRGEGDAIVKTPIVNLGEDKWDILTKLRVPHHLESYLLNEAADEIELLRAERDRLQLAVDNWTLEDCSLRRERDEARAEAERAIREDRVWMDKYEAAVAERDQARAALGPFSVAAGEVFARNYNRGDVVFSTITPGHKNLSLKAEHFFDARAALEEPDKP